jgi:hypothetical protein
MPIFLYYATDKLVYHCRLVLSGWILEETFSYGTLAPGTSGASLWVISFGPLILAHLLFITTKSEGNIHIIVS